MAVGEDAPEFDPEAYIVSENTNVVLTRDGWIKRVGRLASVEGTRVREGDEVIAVVPGSTLDHVDLLRRRRHRLHDAHQRGAGQLRLRRADRQVLQARPTRCKIIGAVTTDERFVAGRDASRAQRRAAGPVPAGRDRPGPDAADAAGPVPHRIHQARPALRPAQRGRQGRDGDGAAGTRRASSWRRATATSSISRSTRSTSCPASARASSASSWTRTTSAWAAP